jgi:hypothetical protein
MDDTMNSLAEFLFAPPARRSTPAIIAWWERRRLAYNAWVGAAGLVSLGTVGVASVLLGGGTDVRGGLLLATAFGLMANLCYLFGPATEIFVERLWGGRVLPTGPALFRIGLTVSVGLALFPTLLTVLLMTARVILGVLGFHWD